MKIIENFILAKTGSHNDNSGDCEVNIITLGCSKNLVDSEQLAYQLEQNAFRVTHESSKPLPVTIINTCGFIQDATAQSVEMILDCAIEKVRGNIKQLIVMGCLSERYADDLLEEIPQIDAVFGVNAIEDILKYLHATLSAESITVRKISTPNHYAYLKVSEGCNQQCAFCAIPKIRGRQVSKPVELIRDEAIVLAEQGVKELILVAQDLTHYGFDIYRKRKLYALLEELVKIKGIEWIRLHYLYPNFFQKDILDLMHDHSKICHYLDLPIQHIDDDILFSMNRKIASNDIRKLLDTIRNKVPDIAIRTTLIVGFPGETKAKFKHLCDFLQESQLDRVGVFPFSKEEDTPAYMLKETVSQREKIRRAEELMAIQHDISSKKNKQKIGKTLKVLIDSEDEDFFTGRTEYDSPEVDNTVLIHKSGKDKNLTVGNFYNVT
ncbi:MAG: 30S ribosomal protein S12 methylthiotransferase RimO, partial [Bacteroidales bacterium]|nr:30S ribosomal protein S12 methylthiotransferase RimO [Bacteroidales bacterium]